MAHITFIHGISNHPRDIRGNWEDALREGGLDVKSEGITTSMVYWADVMYARPPGEEKLFGMAEPEGTESDEQYVETGSEGLDPSWRDELDADGLGFVERLASRFKCDSESSRESATTREDQEPKFGALPLPQPIEKWLMECLLRDVHHYLFNESHSPRPGETYRVRDHIRSLFVEQLASDAAASGGPHVVVSHSMGTVISYDCLKSVKECAKIDHYLTIGSPLGLSEVQEQLPGYTDENGFPRDRVRGRWVNYFDYLDPVSFDELLRDDYLENGAKVVTDRDVSNTGLWRHTAEEYLAQPALCETLAAMLR